MTPNDVGDLDGGANGLQNFAILAATEAAARTRVTGELNSVPSSTFEIDFYASPEADVSGFGEGKRYLGSITVTTNASGSVTFDQRLAGLTVQGEQISAVVTDANGNSSEFSRALVANAIAPPSVDSNSLILTEITEDEDLFGLPTTVFNEGRTVRLDGLFIDAAFADTHTVRIDWGDGSTPTILNIPAGPRGFSAEHLYSDDRPSGTERDIYPISILVSNDDSLASGLATTNVEIVNIAPQFATDVRLSSTTGFEGDTLTLTGSFTDPGSDVHVLRIDWGDGSDVQSVQLPFGARTFSVPHKFLEDSRTVHLWLNDDDALSVSAGETFNVAINNRAPVPSISGPLVGIEGELVTLTASATDPGVNDVSTFNWVVSLGTTPIQQGSGSSVSFTPLNEGTYSVQLTATDNDGATGTVTRNIAISNAAPSVLLSSLTLEDAVTGSNLLTVREGSSFVLTGNFSDNGLDDSHSVEIDWGDGSPLTVISLPRGARAFATPHTYADDGLSGISQDQLPIRVRVIDDLGASSAVVKNVTVANADPEVRIVDNGSDATTVRLKAEVQDPSSTDTFVFAWSIFAGDSPIASLPGGLTGRTIEFPRAGLNGIVTAVVTVTDDDTGVGTDTTTLVIGSNQSDSITVSPSSNDPGSIQVSVSDGSNTATADVSRENTVLVLARRVQIRLRSAHSSQYRQSSTLVKVTTQSSEVSGLIRFRAVLATIRLCQELGQMLSMRRWAMTQSIPVEAMTSF